MRTIGTNTTRLVGIEPREGELLITKIQRAKREEIDKIGQEIQNLEASNSSTALSKELLNSLFD